MNIIIIHGEVFKVSKKDFKLTLNLQEMDNSISDENYCKMLIEHHNYIKSKYKVIQVNPPTLMY